MFPHTTEEYIYYGGVAAAVLAVYILIWRKDAKLANLLVFLGALAIFASAVDWNYILNTYFRISWKLP